jgi:hypothetical protein
VSDRKIGSSGVYVSDSVEKVSKPAMMMMMMMRILDTL